MAAINIPRLTALKPTGVIIAQTVESHSRIASVISNGGVIAFRTDTFYGLGADPFNREAVQRIKQLKGSDKPILIVISDLDQVTRFVADPSQTFHLLAKTFWPGPLTLIGQAARGVPDEITAARKRLACAYPAMRRCGRCCVPAAGL